ncbi:protein of unknown function [Trichlorobacter ammonificans]|uniref:Uncharacterized protein n=1 Tax=Trichlorobacter ammonificans TaxID=2916410 RepID=A0ABM9DA62_9BACT|nr:protein of unknown function [Trichlorobacter ammonificans]
MFERFQQLGNILHNENRCARTFHYVHKWPPQLFSRITVAVFVKQTEALARRTADYYISLRDYCFWGLKNIDYIPDSAVIAEVRIVGFCCVLVEIIGPYRLKAMSGELGKSESHTARASEKVNKLGLIPVFQELAAYPGMVNGFLFGDNRDIILIIDAFLVCRHLNSP